MMRRTADCGAVTTDTDDVSFGDGENHNRTWTKHPSRPTSPKRLKRLPTSAASATCPRSRDQCCAALVSSTMQCSTFDVLTTTSCHNGSGDTPSGRGRGLARGRGKVPTSSLQPTSPLQDILAPIGPPSRCNSLCTTPAGAFKHAKCIETL
jgi:hypothetical protein